MRFKLGLVAAIVLANSVVAHADTVFDVSGTLQSGTTFSGTIDFSPTAGVLGLSTYTAIDVTLSTGAVISGPVSSRPESGGRNLTLGIPETYPVYAVNIYTPDDFPSAAGDTICSLTFACGDDQHVGPNFDNSYLLGELVESGTITPQASSVTPEPSSFALLGTGLLGMAGVVKRRFA